MLGMMNIGGASAERMFSLCRGAADVLGWRFTVGRDFVATTKSPVCRYIIATKR